MKTALSVLILGLTLLGGAPGARAFDWPLTPPPRMPFPGSRNFWAEMDRYENWQSQHRWEMQMREELWRERNRPVQPFGCRQIRRGYWQCQ
jgi:hypothetical protein